MIDKNLLRSHFSRSAANYDRYSKVQKKMASELIELTAEKIPKFLDGKRAMDIGCGTGYLTRLLLENLNFSEILAVDIAEGMISEASKRIKNVNGAVEFRCEDIETAEIGADYDLIVSNAAFQWFNDLANTTSKLFKAVNPNGLMVFSTFGEQTFLELNQSFDQAKAELGYKDDLTLGQNFYGKDELLSLIKDSLNQSGFKFSVSGFESIEHEYFDSVRGFLDSVKKIGANNSNVDRAFKSPALIKKMMDIYEENYREENGVRATYNCVYIVVEKLA